MTGSTVAVIVLGLMPLAAWLMLFRRRAVAESPQRGPRHTAVH
ncbi:MAG: hypothetical protein ACRDQB_09065 [Thermocrispum sp.]